MSLRKHPPDGRSRTVAPRGELHLVLERCKGCQLCVAHCPRAVLEMSRRFNGKGYHPPQMRDAQDCVACGLCEMLCPEFAIYVVEVLHDQ